MLYYVHSSPIYNSQKLERTQISLSGGMDTENVYIVCSASPLSFPTILVRISIEAHLGSFQLLAIINKAAMDLVEHVSLLHAREILWVYAQEWYNRVLWKCHAHFSEELSDRFPEWLYQLAIPSAVEEYSIFSTSSPTPAIS